MVTGSADMGKGKWGVGFAARCRKVQLPGGVTARVCFWCDAVATLTRDHVVPRGAGGAKGAGNVVPACDTCQKERGALVSLYAAARDLRRLAPKLPPLWLRRRVNKQVRKQAYSRRLLVKWVALEIERWGSSPSGDMDLTLPAIPDSVTPAGPPPVVAAVRKAATPVVMTPRPLTGWELD